jgi:hypothetical protein
MIQLGFVNEPCPFCYRYYSVQDVIQGVAASLPRLISAPIVLSASNTRSLLISTMDQGHEQCGPEARTWRWWLRGLVEETGLASMYGATRDVKLLCSQRFVRMFAYGMVMLILVAYLEALNISKTEIGLFMTLTMAGDVCISFLLTLFADALGRRVILAIGALLMTASGVIFSLCGSFWVLLLAAVIGVISPRYVTVPEKAVW